MQFTARLINKSGVFFGGFIVAYCSEGSTNELLVYSMSSINTRLWIIA